MTGFELSKRYEPILRQVLAGEVPCGLVGAVLQGTQRQDFAGIDIVYQVTGGISIGARIRDCIGVKKYTDFTVRYSLPAGTETEIHKLRARAVQRYLYAWVDTQEDYDAGNVSRWKFLDVLAMNSGGLFDEDALLYGGRHVDGVIWKYIPMIRLELNRSVLAESRRAGALVL